MKVDPPSVSQYLKNGEADRNVVQGLFASFRSSIPLDVQRRLLQSSPEELKFIIARHPRISSFHHRRRQSLRHPAMAMSIKNYYTICRRRRLEAAARRVAAEHQGMPLDMNRGYGLGGAATTDNYEAELIDALLSDYAKRGSFSDTYSTHSNPNKGNSLAGSRVGTMSEPFDGEEWNEGSLSISRGGGFVPADHHLGTSDSVASPSQRDIRSTSVTSDVSNVSRGGMPHGSPTSPRSKRWWSSMNDSGAGHSRTGGLFFSQRQAKNDTQSQAKRQETKSMLLLRAKEVMETGGYLDDSLGQFSHHPIAHLLCFYGGTMADYRFREAEEGEKDLEELLADYEIDEDIRWDELAGCHDQLLRAATEASHTAAQAVAQNAIVNDIIRRFWERLTVSAAAVSAHDKQEERKSLVSSHSMHYEEPAAPEIDEDDADELAHSDDDVGVTRSSILKSPSPGPSAARGGRTSLPPGTTSSRKPKPPAGPRNKKISVSRYGVPRRIRQARSSGIPDRKPKGSNSSASSGSKASASAPPTIAFYMTPSQYIYLNTRIAHVLLPDLDSVDAEMLPCIQEDLLIDASYDEKDDEQMVCFGEAPCLVEPVVGRSSSAATNDNQGNRRISTQKNGSLRSSPSRKSMSGGGHKSQRASTAMDVMPRSVVRMYLNVRRRGYPLSIAENNETNSTLDGASQAAIAGSSKKSGSTVDPRSLVAVQYSISQLPSLTYAQFWCSMMELADNWTRCAGLPIEHAIFLMELYSEVFGHSWNDDDKALVGALKESTKRRGKEDAAAEQRAIDEVVSKTLKDFQELVEELGKNDDSMTSVTTDSDKASSSPFTTPSRRRRRGNFGLHSFRGDGASSSGRTSPLPEDNWEMDYFDQVDSDWVYFDRAGNGGITRYFRRRFMTRHFLPRSDLDISIHERHRMEQQGVRRPSTKDSIPFVLEEELDSDGNVLQSRQFRRRVGRATSGKRRGRESDDDETSSVESSDSFMYEDAAENPSYRVRRLFDERPKQLLRLEGYRRADPYEMQSNSSLNSWSSFEELDSGARLHGQRRRGRTRREGPCNEQQRYKRDAEYYYPHYKNSSLMDLDDITKDDALESFSWTAEHEKRGAKPDRSKSGVQGGDGTTAGAAAGGAGVAGTRLTDAERSELRQKMDWLRNVLSKNGITLPEALLDSDAGEVILYQLLRATEAKLKGSPGGDILEGLQGASWMDLLLQGSLGDGALGNSKDVLARLAALLGQADGFSLDDLAKSALMNSLLSAGDDNSAMMNLSSDQLQGIMAALGTGATRRVMETESMRQRRLKVLNALLAQQEAARKREAAEARRKLLEEFANVKSPTTPPDTFGLTELQPIASSSHLRRSAGWRPPSGGWPSDGGGGGDTSPTLRGQRIHTMGDSSTQSKGSAFLPTAVMTSLDLAGRPAVPPLLAAERREQERLFAEFEAYWADRLSHGGLYRLAISTYTEEQLEEFFAHLNLGPRQRSLLRGRAPLASSTSLVGGTMHQNMKKGLASNSRGGTASQPSTSPLPMVAAPVKLFTLTSEPSLAGALRNSYLSYMEDRAYHESMYRPAPGLSAVRAAAEKVMRNPVPPPPPPKSGILTPQRQGSSSEAPLPSVYEGRVRSPFVRVGRLSTSDLQHSRFNDNTSAKKTNRL